MCSFSFEQFSVELVNKYPWVDRDEEYRRAIKCCITFLRSDCSLTVLGIGPRIFVLGFIPGPLKFFDFFILSFRDRVLLYGSGWL